MKTAMITIDRMIERREVYRARLARSFVAVANVISKTRIIEIHSARIASLQRGIETLSTLINIELNKKIMPLPSGEKTTAQ